MEALRDHGYVVVPDFLSVATLESALDHVRRVFPDGAELEDAPWKFRDQLRWGRGIVREFPFFPAELQDLVMADDVMDFAANVVGDDDVRLSQSFLWAKYARVRIEDQVLHLDWNDVTLACPTDRPRYSLVQMTVFYTDVSDTDAPMQVLPRSLADGATAPDFRLFADDADVSYSQCVSLEVTAGSVVFYTDRTFHRGTAFRSTSGCRWSHHLAWHSGAAPWFGFSSWPRFAGEPEMVSFMSHSTDRKRSALGFPPADSDYWSAETLRWIARRYPAMDLSPYRARVDATGLQHALS